MKLCSRLLMFLSKFMGTTSNLRILANFWVSQHHFGQVLCIGLNWTFFATRFPSYEAKCVHFGLFSPVVYVFALKFYLDSVAPSNHPWRQKTRNTELPNGEDRIPLRSLVLTQYRSVTDGRTDKRTDFSSHIQRLFAERCKNDTAMI